jgi:hypothetical protein
MMGTRGKKEKDLIHILGVVLVPIQITSILAQKVYRVQTVYGILVVKQKVKNRFSL